MSAADLERLGYRRGRRGGWVLEHPEARPPKRAGLCRFCRKFNAHPDWGRCAGCLYYGDGDPHGLGRERIRRRLRELGMAER
jgi:hypothetical protein